MKIECTYCHQENDRKNAYCKDCGHALPEPEQSATSHVDSLAAGSVPEIKCGNNHCHWQGFWKDLPMKDDSVVVSGKKTFPRQVSVYPLCGTAEFWGIFPPNDIVSVGALND